MSVSQPIPKAHFLNALCRLRAGTGDAKADWAMVVAKLKEFSAVADHDAIYSFGPEGEASKGSAVAYRELLDLFENPGAHLEELEKPRRPEDGSIP